MDYAYNFQPTLLSCSESHAAAVGVYGQIYVWGKNTYRESRSLIQEEDSESESEKKAEQIIDDSEEESCYQLGIMEEGIKHVQKPIYFS